MQTCLKFYYDIVLANTAHKEITYTIYRDNEDGKLVLRGVCVTASEKEAMEQAEEHLAIAIEGRLS